MNMFDRFKKLIDDTTFDKIKNNTVLVIGVGGVGSYSVEALVRSGIGNIILVDYDIVDKTNINRQLLALNSTIGLKKVDVLRNRIKDINEYCNVEVIDAFIDKDNISDIFNRKIDYVIDACDTISVKKLIIENCLIRKIKFISVMGAGNRFGPTKLVITDIKNTKNDHVSKVIRKWVKDNNIKEKIMVVSSTEVPVKTNDRTPGSTSFVPSVAGIMGASYVINDIISKNHDL